MEVGTVHFPQVLRWDRSQNATSVANQDILRRNVGLPQRTEVAVGRVLETEAVTFVEKLDIYPKAAAKRVMNAIHVVKRVICRETVQRIQMARESATIVEK